MDALSALGLFDFLTKRKKKDGVDHFSKGVRKFDRWPALKVYPFPLRLIYSIFWQNVFEYSSLLEPSLTCTTLG